jgi:hypothetical protein
MNNEDLRSAILGFCDALEGATVKFKMEIGENPQSSPAKAVNYDIELIEWKDMKDTGKGPWQISKDVKNPDYQALLKAVEAGGGSAHTKTHFVWKMEDALGRKRLSDCRKTKG